MVDENGLGIGQPEMMFILDHKDGCTQRDIANFLRVSPATVAVSVKRLQKYGLIEKNVDENDMRCTRMQLTEKGIKIGERSRRVFDSVNERMFSGFTQAEQDQLFCLFEKMEKNLKSI